MANYQITDVVAHDDRGVTYRQIKHPQTFIELTVPEDANACIHPETGETYYTFYTSIEGEKNPSILTQVYGADPGETFTFELFVREKQIKAGFKFLYRKLVRTEEEANAVSSVVTGAYLRSLRNWQRVGEIALIECPQSKHFGAVVIAPFGVELPATEATLVAEATTSNGKWTKRNNQQRSRRRQSA